MDLPVRDFRLVPDEPGFCMLKLLFTSTFSIMHNYPSGNQTIVLHVPIECRRGLKVIVVVPASCAA